MIGNVLFNKNYKLLNPIVKIWIVGKKNNELIDKGEKLIEEI